MASDEITIPAMLGRLQINARHRGIQLARESDRLRRMRRYDEAVTVAAQAAELAKFDYQWQGVILLYYSYALLVSRRPDTEQRALRECDRAIRDLSQSPFNQAIANVIRALLELERLDGIDLTRALYHFKQGAHLLGKVARFAQDQNRRADAERYRQLQQAVDARATQVLQQITTPAAIDIAPKQDAEVPIEPARITAAAQPESAPPDRGQMGVRPTIPLPLPWPIPEPIITFQLTDEPNLSGLDLFESRYVSIENQRFLIEPVIIENVVAGSWSLKSRQPYAIVPLPQSSAGQYAIVRKQVRPDRSRQFVIVGDPGAGRAWLDLAESDEPFDRVHLVGEDRRWHISSEEDIPPRVLGQEPYIYGIVEALLTRALPD